MLCGGSAVGLHDRAAHEQVELLVGAAQFHVGPDRDAVVALQQRVHELEHGDGLVGQIAAGEVVSLQACAPL